MTYGQPPQTPFQPIGYGQQPAPPSTSALAVTALAVSILGICVPIVGPVVAIAFAIAGLVVTGGGRKSGRGMAIAGMLIGVLSLVGCPALTWGTWVGVFKPPANIDAFTRGFVTDIVNGDAQSAGGKISWPLTQADVDKQITTLATLGRPVTIKFTMRGGPPQPGAVGSGQGGGGAVSKMVVFTEFGQSMLPLEIEVRDVNGQLTVCSMMMKSSPRGTATAPPNTTPPSTPTPTN